MLQGLDEQVDPTTASSAKRAGSLVKRGACGTVAV
jgi:hypothetical protein